MKALKVLQCDYVIISLETDSSVSQCVTSQGPSTWFSERIEMHP